MLTRDKPRLTPSELPRYLLRLRVYYSIISLSVVSFLDTKTKTSELSSHTGMSATAVTPPTQLRGDRETGRVTTLPGPFAPDVNYSPIT